MDCKIILTGVAERLSGLREERLSAGTRYRLMGVVADIAEVTEALSEQVLERVRQEAALDVDVDVDFDVLAEEVLSWELVVPGGGLEDLTQQVNDALGGLNDVLTQISIQLERRHKDEAYARLYDQEKRRYLNSGTPRRVRQTFDEWLYDVCNGSPSMDDINDYVTEKLVHMFEKGVFNTKVEHIRRATRYPAEFDFSLLDDDHKLKKSIHKHYSELRKVVDFSDGCLVVNPAKVGRHFYTSRKEENAKAHRNAFLKYMYKIDLAQQWRQKLQAAGTESEYSSLLPDVLATGMAMKYWQRLQKAGFVIFRERSSGKRFRPLRAPQQHHLPEDPGKCRHDEAPVDAQKAGQRVFCGLRTEKRQTFPVRKPYRLQPLGLSVRPFYRSDLRFHHFAGAP